MAQEMSDAIIPVVRAWLTHPAGDPLVIQRDGEGVVITRGYPRGDMTKAGAAKRLGINYRTLHTRYLDKGLLALNRRKKIPAAQVDRLLERIRAGVSG